MHRGVRPCHSPPRPSGDTRSAEGGSRRTVRALAASAGPFFGTPPPGLRSGGRAALRMRMSKLDERARRDRSPGCGRFFRDGGFRKWEEFASRIPRALHRGARSLGAEDRRLRNPQSRRRAGGGGSLHGALAGGEAAFADRRHADRGQRHHRNHRHAHRRTVRRCSRAFRGTATARALRRCARRAH